jgi:hypothetical protein
MINKQALTYALYLSGATMLTLTATAQADSNRLQWNSNKHFYQRFDGPLTWQAAKVKCESKGAHLDTITSDLERDFVNNNLYRDRAFWIGASDATVEKRFAWVTGEKWAYQNWGATSKNTASGDYVWSTTYEWGINSAVDMNVYICEWSTHSYIDFASVPDFNGNGVNEVAVLYVDYVTKKHVVIIRDPKTDTVLSTLTFNSGSIVPQGFVVLNDLNGNGVPEIGVLYSKIGMMYSYFGQPTVDIKDAMNNKVYLSSLRFLNPSFVPRKIAVSADTNGNGSSEIIVLGIGKANNTPKVETRDSKTGVILSDTQF